MLACWTTVLNLLILSVYQVEAEAESYELSEIDTLKLNSTDGDSYEYSEIDISKINKTDDGDRLVGARAARHINYPFLVGWNPYGFDNMFACTGSLISPSYVLSAAHCNGLLKQHNARDRVRQECVEATKRGEFYGGGMSRMKCKWLHCESRYGCTDLEIITEKKGKVWIGIDDVNKDPINNAELMVTIKRHIRHKESYNGGGYYGSYGGYDITLLELDTPVDIITYKPACLPGPSFDDIRLKEKNSQLAGYGLYLRSEGRTCETNKYGKMKMHYCKDKGADPCIKNRDPPMSDECRAFFNHRNTPDEIEKFGKEVRIISESGKTIDICYPSKNPEKEDFGWCKTRGNYYDPDNEDPYENGWGFCSKDCFLDKPTQAFGILRHKDNVEMLSNKLCTKYLQRTLESYTQVKPKILCVARTNKWSEELWVKSRYGYRKVTARSPATRYGSKKYVASVGTCKGDSGGPSFIKEGGRYVVTGVVSGGRGTLGECGGINNPIHYVRVRSFTRWIIQNIGNDTDHLCWDKGFEKRFKLYQRRKKQKERKKKQQKRIYK